MRILTLSQLSLAGSSGIAEVKQPIWFADGTSVGNNPSSLGGAFLADGGSINGNASTSQSKLFTLSSTWISSQKVALEIAGYVAGNTGSYELWDMTSNTAVSGSLITTTSTTETVIRSNQFTLTPSHSYGVTVANNNTSLTYISDASLIIFP